MELKNTALCLFDRPAVQTDIMSNNECDYYPLASVTSGGPIEFHIPGSTEDYIDVSDVQLYIRAKVTKADGTAIAAADKVGLTNLPIAALFQDVSLMLGETQIEGGQMCYPYLAYLSTLMQFSPSAQTSHMQAQGWYKDEAGKFDDDTNTGFVKRKDLIDSSKSFELMGPLFLDFLRQGQFLISQTDMRIKLLRSKPEFALNAYATTTDFKIHFEEVILYVTRFTLNPSVINGHALGLKKQNAIYPLIHTEVTTIAIPKGYLSFKKGNLFPDQAPKLLMIGLVENEAFNGNIKKNPFHFRHFDVSKFALYRDGVSVAGQGFNPDFDNKFVLRSYLNTMRTFNYYNTDETNGLTIEEFLSGYTLYAFDLTADREMSAGHRQPHTGKNLRLELKFKKATPCPVNVVMVASYDSSIEITLLRDVVTHYTR